MAWPQIVLYECRTVAIAIYLNIFISKFDIDNCFNCWSQEKSNVKLPVRVEWVCDGMPVNKQKYIDWMSRYFVKSV